MTQKLWIYDFRTNQNFTLKTRALARSDLDDFVACYKPDNRHERTETERFRAYSYEDLVARDKASLDIFWLRDESLEDTGNLPAPELIAAEIVEDLQAALDQFAGIAASIAPTEARTELRRVAFCPPRSQLQLCPPPEPGTRIGHSHPHIDAPGRIQLHTTRSAL